MKVSFYALKSWQWSSKILVIHSKNMAFLFFVFAVDYIGGVFLCGI